MHICPYIDSINYKNFHHVLVCQTFYQSNFLEIFLREIQSPVKALVKKLCNIRDASNNSVCEMKFMLKLVINGFL